jgi:hypothetical protein
LAFKLVYAPALSVKQRGRRVSCVVSSQHEPVLSTRADGCWVSGWRVVVVRRGGADVIGLSWPLMCQMSCRGEKPLGGITGRLSALVRLLCCLWRENRTWMPGLGRVMGFGMPIFIVRLRVSVFLQQHLWVYLFSE